jgi:hypothetical protein
MGSIASILFATANRRQTRAAGPGFNTGAILLIGFIKLIELIN